MMRFLKDNPICFELHCLFALLMLISGPDPKLAIGEVPVEKAPAGKVNLSQLGAWFSQLEEEAQAGYQHLLHSPYLPADFDEDVVAELASRLSQEEDVDSTSARRLFFQHYGLTARPRLTGTSESVSSTEPTGRSNENGDAKLDDWYANANPVQYVVRNDGTWVMNCFACHGGSVYGTSMPGAPNNRYQLQTLTEDVRASKLRLGKPLTHMDVGSMFMPLGSTVGKTNAVMFGVALMNYRDAELNVHPWRPGPEMVHHDMDPPAWWLMHRKQRIYADGFAEKGHRGLMQFMLVKENGPEKFRQWEDDFREVYAFIESLRAPEYPRSIDRDLAKRGERLFNDHCSHCHGTYGANPNYPEVLVPIEEVGTDPIRLQALTPKHRRHYGESWFAHFGEQETWDDPGGYMAPPLDGIWASPPYFHNGSVPTLWHVLHPEQRPTVWRRSNEAFNEPQVGFQIAAYSAMPVGDKRQFPPREYFDTTQFGKSAAGHDFPNVLEESEKRAVLEYLKTL